MENPPRPASEQPEDSIDVEAARAQLTQLEAVLHESLVALAAIADEMASYRETHLAERIRTEHVNARRVKRRRRPRGRKRLG